MIRPPPDRGAGARGVASVAINSKQSTNSEVEPMGSVIKKRRKRMSKKKHRKLLRKTRHQRK